MYTHIAIITGSYNASSEYIHNCNYNQLLHSHESRVVCLDATNYCSVLDAVYYDNDIVGHISYNLAPKVSAFLRRDDNKGFAEITGMNGGAGYGLEVPCVYRLYGSKVYVNKLKEFIDVVS